jgi:hypothetical protein
MRTPRLPAILILSIGLVSIGTAAEPCCAQFQPAKIQDAKPPDPKNDAVGVLYVGTVTEVTKDSITIRWPGETPKRFPASETLASGGIPKEPRLSPTRRQPYDVDDHLRYRLADVKVGDHVMILFARLGNVDTCDHICIRKRPGGRVPPLPEGAVTPKRIPPQLVGKAPWLEIPYHEEANAYWDLLDKGIPYPEKFGPDRRFPVAPMPREVKLGPPVAP